MLTKLGKLKKIAIDCSENESEIEIINETYNELRSALRKRNNKKCKPKIINAKICIICGEKYKPTSNGQKRCSINCGLRPKTNKDKTHVELDKILNEIKKIQFERESKPYEFAH